MPPRLSLLDEVRKGGFEASLITTFNAYIPFYEEVVLRHLIHAGIRHNVLLMDADQYGVSVRAHPPRMAGRQYTLMPISVGGAFHPKLILLVGKQKGLVVIGSHNLTLAGFGFNRELTNVIRIEGAADKNGVAVAALVWDEVESWMKTTTHKVPAHLKDMVRRVREFAPWYSTKALEPLTDVQILSGRPGAERLWIQLKERVQGRVKDVFVTGAFFDSKLAFLKRIEADLRPQRLFVAIDPATVQMPVVRKGVSRATFVRAEELGREEKKVEKTGGYLHAKGLFIRTRKGESIILSGSANPSAPAWLADEKTRNVELMLVRSGESAEAIAKELGFTAIPEMPILERSDWKLVSENRKKEQLPESPPQTTSVAVVEDGQIFVHLDRIGGLKRSNLVLIGADGKEVGRTKGFQIDNEFAIVTFSGKELAAGVFLRCITGTKTHAEFLLHHVRAVEEQARTGVQKRFKEALLSLETESPNIGLLIDCIDKIIFTEKPARELVSLGRHNSDAKESANQNDGVLSLSVDVADTKKVKRKRRLTHDGDFAYLLDTLIYHLRLQQDKAVEYRDQYGRTEEEQVGADDDEDAEKPQLTEQRRVELLDFCHSKVRTVVNRMIGQLRAYTDGKQPLKNVLIRLLAVLAVLRELRGCDGRVQWVDHGKTTVPRDERYRLLDEVMFSLFEGEESLLHLESLGTEFEHSDDVARLKGLLIWLAWDCGLVLDLHRPFMESEEDLEARLRQNAIMLALAQGVAGDDIVVEEARQSIGSLTSSEMDWLRDLQELIAECEAIKRRDSVFHSPNDTEPGDIALHNSMKRWDLRVVEKNSGKYVALINLRRGKPVVKYEPQFLAMTRLRQT